MPTHNRSDVLYRALGFWARQPEVKSGLVRLVIVDDGSVDDTPHVLENVKNSGRIPLLEVLRHSTGQGPAAARNLGIQSLQAPWVFITGDDVFPPRGFLKTLLSWTDAHQVTTDAVLGPVTWPRSLQATPFMQWLERGGRDFFFNYKDLIPDTVISWSFFYTCNVTLGTELLRSTGGFYEGFPYASHEDLELGSRLEQAGMQLEFHPALLAYHWHPLTLEGAAARVRHMGRSSWLYWNRVADQGPVWKQVARKILSYLARAPWVSHRVERLLTELTDQNPALSRKWLRLMQLSYWVGCGEGLDLAKEHAAC